MPDLELYNTTHEQLKALVKRMGETCLAGETHALAGTQPPGFSRGYEDPELRAAYLIGMNRMQEVRQ